MSVSLSIVPPTKKIAIATEQRARMASTKNAVPMPSARWEAENTIAVLKPRPIAPPAIWNM